jgi:PAS domain S-box-containing protein
MASHPARPEEDRTHSPCFRSVHDSSHSADSNPDSRRPVNGNGSTLSSAFTHCKFEDLIRMLHEFVLVLDPRGEIEVAWSSNASLADQASIGLLGRRVKDVFAPESYDQLVEWLDRGGLTRFEDEAEYSAQLADGLHWFAIRVLPARHASSRLPSCCLHARDITARKANYEVLRKSEALLHKAEQIGKMGSWQLNLETDEVVWSEQLCRLLGQDPNRPPINKAGLLAIIHPDDREKVERLWGAASLANQYREGEARFLLSDGRIRTFHTRAVPLTDAAGRVTGLVALSQDISDKKEEEDRLRKNEMLLAQAEKLANLGSWEYDVPSKTLTWSAQFYRMLGFDASSKPIPYDDHHNVIHPDDVAEAVRDLEDIQSTGKPLENELRFVTAKGDVRFFHSRAVSIKDRSGRVICIRGMSQDVTEHRREEERFRLSETLLAQAEHMANLGSWEFDLKSEKTTLSKSLLRLYGLDCSAEFTREWYWEQVHPSDRRRARILAGRGWRNGKPFVYMVRFRRTNGRTRVHFVRGIPILGPKGRPIGSIGVVQDITDQRRVVQDLRRLSQEVMRTRDQERREAARALHESAGQSLAALKMTLGRLKGAMTDDGDKAQQLWKSAVELTEAAVREVRTVSYLMHPPLLDEAGLAPALRWYVTGFTDRSGIDVSLEVDDHVGRQSQEIETTIFRMVQEALTNVHRYSGSRKAWIRIMRSGGRIRAEVRDEGRGLRVDSKALTKAAPLGVGISGMRERVEQLGGTFELESAPGAGTTLRATLPLAPRVEEAILNSDESEGRDARQQGRKAGRTGPKSV